MTQTINRFNGSDYVHSRDSVRLSDQLCRVFDSIRSGSWMTLEEIATASDAPAPSVSAQLRHLRKKRFGEHIIEKRYEGNGLYRYKYGGIVMRVEKQLIFEDTNK